MLGPEFRKSEGLKRLTLNKNLKNSLCYNFQPKIQAENHSLILRKSSLKSKISGYFFRFFRWGFTQAWLEIFCVIEPEDNRPESKACFSIFLFRFKRIHWIKWILESRNPLGITPENAWLSEIRWVDYP